MSPFIVNLPFFNQGPFLAKTATLLQKTVGDENVMVVKFLEKEIEGRTESPMWQCDAFNKVFKEGISVGRKCYRFCSE